MSYSPYYASGWLTGETGATPITPEALNHMDQGIANATSKQYTVTLYASAWEGTEAPYAQTKTVAGILSTDWPHWGVVYSGTLANKLAQKEAFEVIDDLETADGSVTFYCFEEKPTVAIDVRIEVN